MADEKGALTSFLASKKEKDVEEQVKNTLAASPVVSAQDAQRHVIEVRPKRYTSADELVKMVSPNSGFNPKTLYAPAMRPREGFSGEETGVSYGAVRADSYTPATQTGKAAVITNNPELVYLGAGTPRGARIAAEYPGEKDTFYLKQKFEPVEPYPLPLPNGQTMETTTTNLNKAMWLYLAASEPARDIDWWGYYKLPDTKKEGPVHAVARGLVNAIPQISIRSAGFVSTEYADAVEAMGRVVGDDAVIDYANSLRKIVYKTTEELLQDMTWQYAPSGNTKNIGKTTEEYIKTQRNEPGDMNANRFWYLGGQALAYIPLGFMHQMQFLPFLELAEAADSAMYVRQAMEDKGRPFGESVMKAWAAGGAVYAIGITPKVVETVAKSMMRPAQGLVKLSKEKPEALRRLVRNQRLLVSATEAVSEPTQDVVTNEFAGESPEWEDALATLFWSALISYGTLAATPNDTPERVKERAAAIQNFVATHQAFLDAIVADSQGAITRENIDMILAGLATPEETASTLNYIKEAVVANFDKLTDDQKKQLNEYIKNINPDSDLEKEFAKLDKRIDKLLDDSAAADQEYGGTPLTENQRALARLILRGVAANQLSRKGILPSEMELPSRISGSFNMNNVTNQRKRSRYAKNAEGRTDIENGSIVVNNELQGADLPVGQVAMPVQASGNMAPSASVKAEFSEAGVQSPQSVGFAGLSHEFWHWIETATGLPKVGEFMTGMQQLAQSMVPDILSGKEGVELSEAYAYAMGYAGDKLKAVLGFEGPVSDYIDFMNLTLNAQDIAQGTTDALKAYMDSYRGVLKANREIVNDILDGFGTEKLRGAVNNFIETGEKGALTLDDIRGLNAAINSAVDVETADNLSKIFDSPNRVSSFMRRYAEEYDNLLTKDRGDAIENYKKNRAIADAKTGVDKTITPATAMQNTTLAKADEIITQPEPEAPKQETKTNKEEKPKTEDKTVQSKIDLVDDALLIAYDNAADANQPLAPGVDKYTGKPSDPFVDWPDDLKAEYKKFNKGKLDPDVNAINRFKQSLVKEQTSAGIPEEEKSPFDKAEIPENDKAPRIHVTGDRAGTPYDVDSLVKGRFDDAPEMVVGFLENAAVWAKEDNITKEDLSGKKVNIFWGEDNIPAYTLEPSLMRGNKGARLIFSRDANGNIQSRVIEAGETRADHRAAYVILAKHKLKQMAEQGKLTPALKKRAKATEMFAVASNTINAMQQPLEYLSAQVSEDTAPEDVKKLHRALATFNQRVNNEIFQDFSRVDPLGQAKAAAREALNLYEFLEDTYTTTTDDTVKKLIAGLLPGGENWIQSALGDKVYSRLDQYRPYYDEKGGFKMMPVPQRSLARCVGEFYDYLIRYIETQENDTEVDTMLGDAYKYRNNPSMAERRAIGVLKSQKTSGAKKWRARVLLGSISEKANDPLDKYFSPDYNAEYSDQHIDVQTMSVAEAFAYDKTASAEEKQKAAAFVNAGKVQSPYVDPRYGYLKRDIINTPTPLQELGISMEQAEEEIRAAGLEPYNFMENDGTVSEVAKQLLSKDYISSNLNSKKPDVALKTRRTMLARLLQTVPSIGTSKNRAERLRVLHAIDSAKAAVDTLFAAYVDREDAYNNDPTLNPRAFESGLEFVKSSQHFENQYKENLNRGYTEEVSAQSLMLGDEIAFPYGNKFVRAVVAFKGAVPSGARTVVLYEDVDLDEWNKKDLASISRPPLYTAASEMRLNSVGIMRKPIENSDPSRLSKLSKLFDRICATHENIPNIRRIAEALTQNADDSFLVTTKKYKDGNVISTIDIGKYDIESIGPSLRARTDQRFYQPKKQVNDWRSFNENEYKYASTQSSVVEGDEAANAAEYDADDEANFDANEYFSVASETPTVDPGAFVLMETGLSQNDWSLYQKSQEGYIEAVEQGTVTPEMHNYMWERLNARQNGRSEELKQHLANSQYIAHVVLLIDKLRKGLASRADVLKKPVSRLLGIGASGSGLDRRGRMFFGDGFKDVNTIMASSRAQAISESKRHALDKATMDTVFGGSRQKYERWLVKKGTDKFNAVLADGSQVKITRGEIIGIAMAKTAVERNLIDTANYTNEYERMRKFYQNVDELLGYLTEEDMKFVNVGLHAIADARGTEGGKLPVRKQMITGPDGKTYMTTETLTAEDFDPMLAGGIMPAYWVPSVLGTDYLKNGWDARPYGTPDNSFAVISSQEALAAPDAYDAIVSLIGSRAMKESHLIDELQSLHDALLFADIDRSQFKQFDEKDWAVYNKLITESQALREELAQAVGATQAKWFVENIKTDLKYNPALKEFTANPVLGTFQKITRSVASSLLMLSPKQGLVNLGNYHLFLGLSNSGQAKFYTADWVNAIAHFREAWALALENPEFRRRLEQSGLSEQMRRTADTRENSLLRDLEEALRNHSKEGIADAVSVLNTISKVATKYGLATNVLPDFVGIALGNYAVYNDVLTKNSGNVVATQQEIANFILNRVSSSNYQTRSAATKTLQRMGLEALVLFQNDQLQKVGMACEAALDLMTSDDPAVRKRAWKDIEAAAYSTLRYVAIQAGWLAAIIGVLTGADLSDEEKDYLYDATLREAIAQIGGTTQLGSVITPVLNGLIFGRDMGVTLAPFGSVQRAVTAARKGNWLRTAGEGAALSGFAPIMPSSVRVLDAMYKIATGDENEASVGWLMLGGRSPATAEKMLGLTRGQKTGKLQPKKSSKKKNENK